MKAVILAAGRGTRMPELTKDRPKCLIRVGEKTIIERQIEILRKNSVEDIYVVIGYKADRVREKIGDIDGVELIMNEEYEVTDNIYSLYLVSNHLKGEEFILLNGDVIFEEAIIEKLVSKEGDIAPVDSKYYDLEELKIRERDGRVVEILPKDASRESSDGSTIGIFKLSSKGSEVLFDEIEKCIEKELKRKWFEYALNNVLKEIKMYCEDVHGLKWVEADTPEDIEKALELFGR
ncbi:MAG: NTP transferase domain-containing protein [Candidatus Hydrothermarchaeota archaeon]